MDRLGSPSHSSGVRAATRDDIPVIARIHKTQFAGHLLARYSLTLIERFYMAFLDEALFLVHEGEGGIDGFVVGAERRVCGMCRRAFVRASVLRSALETLWKPQLALGAIRQASRSFLPRRHAPHTSPPFRLLSIAVDPIAAGTGVAAALVWAFERSIPGGFATYGLSVREGNVRAIRFYEKMGFRRESVDTAVGHCYYAKETPDRCQSMSCEDEDTVADGELRRLAG